MLGLALVACGKGDPERRENVAGSGRLVVSLTLDWEGAYLHPEALDALFELRERLPGVPITHFICPAYFTRAAADPGAAATIREQILGGDEAALHIHAWRSLARAAGLEPRAEPIFLDEPVVLGDDTGFAVDFAAYGEADARTLIRRAKTLLSDADIETPTSFRAGGFSMDPALFAAIRAEGYSVDSSAVWPGWVQPNENGERFARHLAERWPSIRELEQPYVVATNAGPVLEMPVTAMFVEYADADEMKKHFAAARDLLAQHPERDVFVALGFHQETAHEFKDQLLAALAPLTGELAPLVEFSTTAEAAARAKRQLAKAKR